MARYRENLTVPYSAEQMFDLASDIESYPLFLDGWRAVRVLREVDDTRLVEQVVGTGPLKWRFCSHATASRPTWLEITSNERPFQRLEITWRFQDLAEGGAAVGFAALAELRSRQASALASKFLDARFGHTVSAFERRAHALYGPA